MQNVSLGAVCDLIVYIIFKIALLSALWNFYVNNRLLCKTGNARHPLALIIRFGPITTQAVRTCV